MNRRRAAHLSIVAAIVTCLSAVLPPAVAFDELTPAVVPFSPPVSTAIFPTSDFGKTESAADDRFAATKWRVIEGTGNCCENYLTTTRTGRLLDFGGRYIHFSDDRGETWKRVQPILPLANGEGAIVVAPGGDVLGVEWDPYSGDHLQFYKYEASTDSWRYTEMPIHQPFYDREWIAVVPGPITVDGATHEYVSFVKGGVPKELWFYSTDGIHYHRATSKGVEQMLEGREVVGPLPTTANAESDWIQPNTNMGLAQLGRSDALAAPDVSDWALFEGDSFEWSTYRFPDGPDEDEDGDEPTGLFQVDSAGAVHNVIPTSDSFTYRVSQDGGTTWSEVMVDLPQYHSIEEIDFRAHRGAGVAAVAIHAQDGSTGDDQDLLYKFDIRSASPRLTRLYEVGLGDVNSEAGVGNPVRLDFQSVAIFRDGRVAVSFIDSTTTMNHPIHGMVGFAPAIAVEIGTKLRGAIPVEEDVEPVLGDPYASFTWDAGDEGWVSEGLPTTWERSSPGTKTGEDDPSTASFGIEGRTGYVDNVNATLTSPAITTDAGLAVMEFWIKHDLEDGFDFTYAEWSADGENWLPVASFTGRNGEYPAWRKITVGFDSPGGDVFVRFRFESDQLCSSVPNPAFCSGTWTGVRVDEVVVGRQAE